MSTRSPENIDLWHGRLAATEHTCRHYWSVLDATEQARANRFLHPKLKYRYVEAHGLLRHILAHYTSQPPDRVNIQTTKHGKPYLVDCPHWTFNLSHTADSLVIAVGKIDFLGVDIEHSKPLADLPQLVARCFADSEAAYWESLDEGSQLAAFYRIWTAKEAFVKATGRGMALGLQHCVTDPHRPGRFARLPTAYGAAGCWRITHLLCPGQADLHGALVLKTSKITLNWLDFCHITPVSSIRQALVECPHSEPG